VARPILVTGAAGFIGYHVARRLAGEGRAVVGVDNLSDYYDPRLKEARLAALAPLPAFAFERLDLSDADAVRGLFARHSPSHVVHLAAQPGVRRALTEPEPYVAANVAAFLHVLEGCRHGAVAHLVYASSSSVYGANRRLPFSEHHGADHPVSLYAATKRAGELMAHSYAGLFGLPATGLRFFTVYGPWGRPDMAVYAFTDAIANGRPIQVAADGLVRRDFTYVDDIVEGIVRLLDRPARPDPDWNAEAPDPATAAVPHRVYNIGNDSPVELNALIALIEEAVGRKAERIAVPLPPGDVFETRADVTDLRRDVGFSPSTPLAEGVARFVEWYRAERR
jgi:UDP-glucuronate 4-epimerase